MDISQIKIKLDGGIMPKKQSKWAAAYDLYCPKDTLIHVGRQVIDLGFSMEMPHNIKADIRPRSGFSLRGLKVRWQLALDLQTFRDEIKVLDADVLLGTIDADYRNNVGVLLNVHSVPVNLGAYYIAKGERIAQMVFSYVPPTDLVEVGELDMTDDRGGGFGHTNEK